MPVSRITRLAGSGVITSTTSHDENDGGMAHNNDEEKAFDSLSRVMVPARMPSQSQLVDLCH